MVNTYALHSRFANGTHFPGLYGQGLMESTIYKCLACGDEISVGVELVSVILIGFVCAID
jgi:hypothetical protein